MPKITNQTAQQAHGVHKKPHDETAPPTPQIVRTMAFDKAKDGSTVHANATGGFSSGRRDPAYIELSNVEIGTHLELINLSADPGANWDGAIKLEFTGRDVKNRTASVYLKQTQLEKLGLKPGDVYQLRAVDDAGNASGAASGELQGTEWANQRVLEDGAWVGRGAAVNVLDGENARKQVIAKGVNDSRPPLLREDAVSIVTKGNGQKSMVFDRALEPQANVTIQNSRTGASFNGRVDQDGQLTIPLTNVEDGDPLLVCTTDNNGVAGKDLEIVYSKACADGKAPKLKGGLATRLPGVL